MKLILLIIFFCLSCLSFGQDSLQTNTTNRSTSSNAQDNVTTDSVSLTPNKSVVKKKKQKKKVLQVLQPKYKEEPVISKKEYIDNEDTSGGPIIGILILGLIIVLVYFLSTSDKHENRSGKEDPISDYLNRMLMSRSEYYNEVYLKSDAWKRKRFVVLRRDNWRCVYCGGKATQVHHKRYAKRNIGKEPIEWLVSICKSCHDSIHS